MRLFTRIVERRSFSRAAEDIGVPRATVSRTVADLEERLGVRLLQRTTRTVSPTLDGEAYYRRCLAILDDIEDAEGAFSGARPKGTLRIEVQGTLFRHFLLPALPDFLALYPELDIVVSEGERWVDLVREGVDCVLRYGALPDSEMVQRRMVMLERLTCAAPAYIERYGVPASIDQLDGHHMVGLRSLTTGTVRPLEFETPSGLRSVTLPSPVSVTGTESYLPVALLGLGLFQVPRFHAEVDLREGRLVQILADTPPPSAPVSILYPRNRQLSPRVRLFIDWAAQQFAKRATVSP